MYPNNQQRNNPQNNQQQSFNMANAALSAQQGARGAGPYGQGGWAGQGSNQGYNQPGGGYNDPYNKNAPFNPYNQGGYRDNDDFNNDNRYHEDEGLAGPKLYESSRIGFIRKVYSILSAQLILTAVMCGVVMGSEDVRMYLYQNPWIVLLSAIITIPIMYALGCYPAVARSVPINYVLLFTFTICESILVACICSQYDAKTVFIAAALTAAAVVGLTVYAFTTKSDFTMCGGLLFVLVLVLLVAGIISIFIHNRWLQLFISIFGVLVFAMYLVYDTQLIIGNKSQALGVDDYIWAAMMLYIDIIQIFLHILRLVGDKN